MMFDNLRKRPGELRESIREYGGVAALSTGAVSTAIGMHFASMAAFVAGAGLLLLGCVLLVVRSRATRHREGI